MAHFLNLWLGITILNPITLLHRLHAVARLSLSLTAIFVSLNALAEPLYTPNTYEGQVDNWKTYCQHFSKSASPLVDEICIKKIVVNYNLSLLMGEPVERYRVYWEIDPTLHLRPGVTLDGKGKSFTNAFTLLLPGEVSIDSQTPAVQKTFAALTPIFPTKFVIAAGSDFYFMFDGGDLKPSGKGFSYNTPGSPNWDKFILNSNYYSYYQNSKPLPYLTTPQAKHLYLDLKHYEFSFSRILDLTFSGVTELNLALRGELVYPLTVNIHGPGGSQISILNNRSVYKPGIMLKAGRYRIRVTHPGFKPVEKWVSLNAKHQSFSVRLEKSERKQKKTKGKENADSATTTSEDELGSMLDQTETPQDNNSGDNPFAEDSQSSGKGSTSANDLGDMLNQVGRQDTEQLQQAKAEIHSDNLRPIKEKYKATVKQCNAGQPEHERQPCTGIHLTVSCYSNDQAKQDACERQKKADEIAGERRCNQLRDEWRRHEATFPQRLEVWKRENRQCVAKVLSDYNAAVKNLKTNERNIDDFAGALH